METILYIPGQLKTIWVIGAIVIVPIESDLSGPLQTIESSDWGNHYPSQKEKFLSDRVSTWVDDRLEMALC